jgi:hypothetical protein
LGAKKKGRFPGAPSLTPPGANCQFGDAALLPCRLTPGSRRSSPRPVCPDTRTAFLRRITAQGFRGIGPKATLDLTPGPGLTLVVGRNGSGKSSFAEGLELLLTGDTDRWSQRSKVAFLSKVLGLDALVDAQTALQQARSARDKARKDADQERRALLALLEDVEDERAQRVKDALSQKD